MTITQKTFSPKAVANNTGAVVVPKLAERSLPMPKIRGSNPVISNCFIFCLLYRKEQHNALRS